MGLLGPISPGRIKKQFNCLGENTEKYITFTVPVKKKVTRIDRNGKETTKNIFYTLQFINSARYLYERYLYFYYNNLSERIHRIKCKLEHDDKFYTSLATVLLNIQVLKMI